MEMQITIIDVKVYVPFYFCLGPSVGTNGSKREREHVKGKGQTWQFTVLISKIRLRQWPTGTFVG